MPLIDSVVRQDEFVLINNVLTNITKWKNQSKISILNQVYRRF